MKMGLDHTHTHLMSVWMNEKKERKDLMENQHTHKTKKRWLKMFHSFIHSAA